MTLLVTLLVTLLSLAAPRVACAQVSLTEGLSTRETFPILPGVFLARVTRASRAPAVGEAQAVLALNSQIQMDDLERWIGSAPNDFSLRADHATLVELRRLLGPRCRHCAHLREFVAGTSRDFAWLRTSLREQNLPPELMGIPFVESAFRNHLSRHDPAYRKPAGLWMMVPTTARNYGLKVRRGQDERLDREASTRAALRHLVALRQQFRDWRLALIAYNQGEAAARRYAADPHHSATRLARAEQYVARVNAAALLILRPQILGNPSPR